MLKTLESDGMAKVVLTLDPEVGAETASVCGDWNGWSAELEPMSRTADGGFSLTLHLETGRRYRFRYLLDGVRWENDWAADAYEPNEFGQDDSVLDLTVVELEGPAAEPGPKKRASTPKKAPAAEGVKEPVAKARKKAVARAEGAQPVKKKSTKKAIDPTAKVTKKSPKA